MEYQIEFSHGTVHLNEEQYKVVTSPPHENQRILASAGSGKTTTITARIAYLIEEYHIDPCHILLVTFSRGASKEMIHRVHRLVGPIPLYAGTFHGISHQILREFAPDLIREQPFIDELPYLLVKWLDTDAGQKWAKRFISIIVDEFQDINEIQWKLLSKFYHERSTMTIVGDDAQNIYTWRGSSVHFILDFHKKIKHVHDYQLCRNYRSTEAIVRIANAVMRFIPTLPFKEKMVANKKGGRKPEIHFFFRSSDECDWIVQSLHKLLKQHESFSFAVLSRYNSDLYKIEERLHLKGIPHQLISENKEHHEKSKLMGNVPRLTLATIHASKGLEWDIVFFMNLHDDVFPSRKGDEDIIAERRLFYVGITRAKQGLYMTYSKQERSLSRFVREIPRPFLRYHNVASFQLSTSQLHSYTMTLDDMIRGLDGGDWNQLREQRQVPIITENRTTEIYGFGQLFLIPEWVKQRDVRETWLHTMKWITLRECARAYQRWEQLLIPVISEVLLTLRIYREDFEFWQFHEAEFEHLVHHFLKPTRDMSPVEYGDLAEYITQNMPHLPWTALEISHASIILAKIRGQLRPLRHKGFDLKEFSIGWVRNAVPTELKPDVLESWHAFIDPTKRSCEILSDTWRIAALSSVIEGRNIPLYQHRMASTYLMGKDQQCIIEALEIAIPLWMSTQENPMIYFHFEPEGIRPLSIDLLTDRCAYQVAFDVAYVPSNEDKILLLLKQYAYELTFAKPLCAIGFFNSATGIITEYEITPTIRAQLSQMWQFLQQKYKVFAEVLSS